MELSSNFPPTLSEEQREIVKAAVLGEPDQVLADRFHFSKGGLKYHISRIYAVYGVRSRAQLILKFYNLPPYKGVIHETQRRDDNNPEH